MELCQIKIRVLSLMVYPHLSVAANDLQNPCQLRGSGPRAWNKETNA
jgi:hypothetical protein